MKPLMRAKAALILLVGCCLATSCTQTGYQVVKVQSVVPYHRLDLRDFGPPQARIFFLMGLHCLNPLTLVYSIRGDTGEQDPNHYYALVRKDDGWKKVHLSGELQLYDAPERNKYASPPDGRAYRSRPETREPRVWGEIHESKLSGLPSGLDLSFADLSNATAGYARLFQFSDVNPMHSLLFLNYVYKVGKKDATYEVYSLGQRQRLIKLKLNGFELYHFRLAAEHQFRSGKLDSGFLLFQPNFNEVLIFDLREYWPKFPQNPGEPEPQCVPLL